MKKPMTTYKIEAEIVPTVSFKLNRYNQECYAEKGMIKTYANQTQAHNKMWKLREEGINVSVSLSHPFLLLKQK